MRRHGKNVGLSPKQKTPKTFANIWYSQYAKLKKSFKVNVITPLEE